MSVEINRTGWIGLAIEAEAGTAEATPDIFVPFTECTLEEKHEPLLDISARASREQNYDAVSGKKWGEGRVVMNLDQTNLGYFLKLACGNEAATAITAGPPAVSDHLFYVTTSGNAAKTATLWLYRGSGVSVKRFTYAAIDSLAIAMGMDGIPTVSADFITDNPTAVSAPTLTTTSGTILTWSNAVTKFGDTPNAAESATATKISSFNMTLNNNLQTIYRTGTTAGDSSPDVIALGPLTVTGDYTTFLEGNTELDYYTGATKKSMVVQFTGAGLGSGYTEYFKIVVKDMIHHDKSISTGLEDFRAFTGNWTALHSVESAGFCDWILRNGKVSVYS